MSAPLRLLRQLSGRHGPHEGAAIALSRGPPRLGAGPARPLRSWAADMQQGVRQGGWGIAACNLARPPAHLCIRVAGGRRRAPVGGRVERWQRLPGRQQLAGGLPCSRAGRETGLIRAWRAGRRDSAPPADAGLPSHPGAALGTRGRALWARPHAWQSAGPARPAPRLAPSPTPSPPQHPATQGPQHAPRPQPPRARG